MRLYSVLAVFALTACASKMSSDECASADWASIGQRDGLYGEDSAKLAERTAQCASFGVSTDAADYEAGRARGLKTYCTPDAGFDAGRNGRDYRDVCPAELEGAFLAEYNIGRRLNDLNREIETARSAYDNALSTIESDKYELKRALERYNDSNLSEDDRSRAVRDVDRYRRNIDRLEDDLPRLDREIEQAESALEDYRGYLDRRARS